MPNDAAKNRPSLEEVNRSVQIPSRHWWRRLLAFAGPAYLVSVGYMDPGNWATDIAGGSQFGYMLLWVLLMSNLMAVLLQVLAARLGIVTGHDLAQACRDDYPRFTRYVLFGLCEIAITATDLAEVLGSAIGLNLLFNLPLLYGVVITGGDVLLLLLIHRLGMRKMEAFIVLLISTIGLCFLVEVFLSKPSPAGMAGGLLPHPMSSEQIFVAIGIIGATVMPHNLYLHSSLVQSRDVARSRTSVAQACRYNFIDSAIAMNGAFFINAAILVVAAAVLYGANVTELGQASDMLKNLLGSKIAPIAFGVGLLCSGQSSTITGTLAGQITMEGFLDFRIRPWVRRLTTRCMAILPAILVILLAGERQVTALLILSQVVLSLQLPFAIVPLVRFTSSKVKMGPFANRLWVAIFAWLVAVIIIALNGKLVYDQVCEWSAAAGGFAWAVQAGAIAASAAMAVLLAWMTFRREPVPREYHVVSADEVVTAAAGYQKHFSRIGVALEAKATNGVMLAQAIALARVHQARLVLMHVVEGVGGQWYGPQTGDLESRQDEAYLDHLAAGLHKDPATRDLPVETALGFGDVPGEIVRLSRESQVDLLVAGGHGHRGLADLIHGTTIGGVRHGLEIPLLAVRRMREKGSGTFSGRGRSGANRRNAPN